MSELSIRPATRKGVRPIIDLYSESGGGKTYSALLLARGFVGPTGKMVMVDTESGRGELYSDVKEIGGYEVLSLGEPFSPAHYIQAVDAVERSGATIGILDSGSHEWEGLGGVLDQADESREKSGKDGLHNWRRPKMEHALFLQKLLRSSIPWIICLRAKYKTRQAKEGGKTVIIKDDALTPIQADDFIFEATAHGWIDLQHRFWPTKISHPALASCLPNGQPITLEHGRLLAQWCAAPGVSPSAPATTVLTSTANPANKLLADIRTATESIHGWHKGDPREKWESDGRQKLEAWLLANQLIGDGVRLADLSIERLEEVLAEVKRLLRGGGQLL